MRRVLFLIALAAATTARAQVLSVYATSTNMRASNVQTGVIGSTNQYTSFFTSGIGGGITLGALPLGPIHLGFDLRGSTKPGVNGFDTALGGLRLGIKPPLIKLKPYVQASVGYVATRTTNLTTVTSGSTTTTPGGTFTNQYIAYQAFAGVDYPILPILDFRIVEIGAGQGFSTGLTFSSNAGNISLFNINTGLVLHF